MSQLGEHLRKAGLTVDDNGAPARTARWQRPAFVVLHHYAGSEWAGDAERQAQYLRTGGPYPPNAHGYIDITGKVWITCAPRSGDTPPGRATHMGQGSYPGIPTDRGNELCVGWEVQADGTRPLAELPHWPVVVTVLRESLNLYGLPVSRLIGHKEYAGRAQGKVDPLDDMDWVRAQVEKGPDMPLTDADVKRVADAVWDRMVGKDLSGEPRDAAWMLTSARNLSAKNAGLGDEGK